MFFYPVAEAEADGAGLHRMIPQILRKTRKPYGGRSCRNAFERICLTGGQERKQTGERIPADIISLSAVRTILQYFIQRNLRSIDKAVSSEYGGGFPR